MDLPHHFRRKGIVSDSTPHKSQLHFHASCLEAIVSVLRDQRYLLHLRIFQAAIFVRPHLFESAADKKRSVLAWAIRTGLKNEINKFTYLWDLQRTKNVNTFRTYFYDLQSFLPRYDCKLSAWGQRYRTEGMGGSLSEGGDYGTVRTCHSP